MPRRATSRNPARARQLQVLVQQAGPRDVSPGWPCESAARASRKCTRDCRCARFGTVTSSSPPGCEHAMQFCQGRRLFLERQVLEHVEAQRARERRRRRRAAPRAIPASRGPSCSSGRGLRYAAARGTHRRARPRRSRRRAPRVPAGSAPDTRARVRVWRGRSGRTPSRRQFAVVVAARRVFPRARDGGRRKHAGDCTPRRLPGSASPGEGSPRRSTGAARLTGMPGWRSAVRVTAATGLSFSGPAAEPARWAPAAAAATVPGLAGGRGRLGTRDRDIGTITGLPGWGTARLAASRRDGRQRWACPGSLGRAVGWNTTAGNFVLGRARRRHRHRHRRRCGRRARRRPRPGCSSAGCRWFRSSRLPCFPRASASGRIRPPGAAATRDTLPCVALSNCTGTATGRPRACPS